MTTTATLRDGEKFAVFTWHDESDIMQVDIKAEQLINTQNGMMSKAAAREFWNMLKEQGYTQTQEVK